MDKVMIIFSDGHAGIPTESYAEYAEAKDREAFAEAVAVHRACAGDGSVRLRGQQ